MSDKPEWQQRVIDERQQLQDRLTKLDTYIATNPKFLELDEENRMLLVNQQGCMLLYRHILTERILRFQPEA